MGFLKMFNIKFMVATAGFTILSLTGTLAGTLAGAMTSMPGMQMDSAGKVAVHGMFAFGEKTLYLSHLPMFHPPHDYQVIVEAVLDEKGMEAYAKAKKGNLDQMVTIVPEPFSLQAMIKHPMKLHADLYKGHFERGGVLLAKSVIVTIVKIVHVHKLGESSPNAEPLISFGEGDERYQAHFIQAAPDFDEIERLPSQNGQSAGVSKVIYREDQDLE